MTGTEKQAAWAETIKSAKMADVDAAFAAARPSPGGPEADAILKAHEVMRSDCRAAWWIDNRDRSGLSLLRDIGISILGR